MANAGYDPSTDDATPSTRTGEELLRALARLKLRLEVCLREERDATAYRRTLVASLADIDAIVRASSALVARDR
jgi:hypothetical protein